MKRAFKFGNNTDENWVPILFIVLFFFLIILIPCGGWCYANRDVIVTKFSDLRKTREKFANFTPLKSTDQLSPEKDSCIFVLADWCGHCKNLKASGMLTELAKGGINVIVLDDKHPQAQMVMQELQSKGFTTLGFIKGGKLIKYDGPRTAQDMAREFQTLR